MTQIRGGGLVFVIIYIVSCLLYISSGLKYANRCYQLCEDHSHCKILSSHHSKNREIALITEGKSDYKKWPLSNVTIIMTADMDEDEAIKLSCYAHQHNINYAFIAQALSTTNTSDSDFQSWLSDVSTKIKNTYSDYVVIDFLKLMGKCQEDHSYITEVFNVVSVLHTKFANIRPQQMICIMPWKPPCFHGNCSLTSMMSTMCSMYIINPESFLSSCDSHCNAKATIPMSSLVIGINEYLNSGVGINRLMLGVPWHGYDYECKSYVPEKAINGMDVCYVATVVNGTEGVNCDFENGRQKITFPKLMKDYRANYNKVHDWSPVYHAPYFSYNHSGHQHQIWYESLTSLMEKYRLAKDLDLRGIVIYTADDISENEALQSKEFSWLMHTLFSSGKYLEPKRPQWAGIVAGIGVGCLVLGTILGFLMACAILRKRSRSKRRRLPFEKDDDEGDGFHDDDNIL